MSGVCDAGLILCGGICVLPTQCCAGGRGYCTDGTACCTLFGVVDCYITTSNVPTTTRLCYNYGSGHSCSNECLYCSDPAEPYCYREVYLNGPSALTGIHCGSASTPVTFTGYRTLSATRTRSRTTLISSTTAPSTTPPGTSFSDIPSQAGSLTSSITPKPYNNPYNSGYTATTNDHKTRLSKKLIAGGCVGALCIIAVTAFVFYFYRRPGARPPPPQSEMDPTKSNIEPAPRNIPTPGSTHVVINNAGNPTAVAGNMYARATQSPVPRAPSGQSYNGANQPVELA